MIKQWVKPVVETPISTTNYVLSKRIKQTMKRTHIMEQELNKMQTKMVSRRTKMIKARKGTPPDLNPLEEVPNKRQRNIM